MNIEGDTLSRTNDCYTVEGKTCTARKCGNVYTNEIFNNFHYVA